MSVQDPYIKEQDYVDIGLSCAGVCQILDRVNDWTNTTSSCLGRSDNRLRELNQQ